MNPTAIHFEQVTLKHKEIIFQWLDKPHVKEFWDNSQEHRDDILNFMDGRKSISTYFDGIFSYWIGFVHNEPFSFLLTADYNPDENSPIIWRENCSKAGKTITIDFCIGNENYLGKGLASFTLEMFTRFFKKTIDKNVDTFLIDPDANNLKACHVYQKAGFKIVGSFTMENGYFTGKKSFLMVKHSAALVKADIASYPIIQAMSLFYIYEMYCQDLPGWEYPRDGQFKSLDYKNYFNEPNHAYLIKVNEELAGFALIDKISIDNQADWNMGQFFVLGKFQQRKIGESVVFELWEIAVIPENKRALNFWRNIIKKYTHDNFTEELKTFYSENNQIKRFIFSFKVISQ